MFKPQRCHGPALRTGLVMSLALALSLFWPGTSELHAQAGLGGWLGLELVREIPGNELQVRDVLEGSPAEAAGVQPGHRILRINGAEPTQAELARIVNALVPGSTIRLTLAHPDAEGRDRREVSIQAGQRPAILPGPEREVHVRSRRPAPGVVQDSGVRDLRMDLDSVRAEMARDRRELAGSQDAAPSRDAPRDVREVARSQIQEGDAPAVLLGMRVVGGAELAPLDPELARSFHVDGGVLVLEVLDGTPAKAAGLEPGDVIVAVEGEVVTTIAQFRQALNQAWREPPVDVQVIREGQRRSLSFPR